MYMPRACPLRFPPPLVAEAVACLRAGGVVAFPTETFYGLAVDPFNEKAVSKLFLIKQRSTAKPILTLIHNMSQLPQLAASIPNPFGPLMQSLWPGPLTLIFPAQPSLPSLLTGQSRTVGIRISSHPHAAQLIAAFGGPLTATSANLSGKRPAVSARQIARVLQPGIDLILDGGETPGGKGSTIVAARSDRLVLIRDGATCFANICCLALEKGFSCA